MLDPRIRGRRASGPIVLAAAAYGIATCFVLLVVLTVAPAVQLAAETHCTAGPAPPPSAVVALLTQTSSGRFVQRGSGFCVEPDVVVSARDKGRVGTDVYVRVERSERLFKATPVASAFFSDLDVYKIEGANAGTLRLSETSVQIGDAVDVSSLPFFGKPTLTAHVSSLQGQGVFAVALPAAPLSAEVGGPVVTADGMLVGVLTSLRLRNNDYLVVPAARIAARLSGEQEPGAPLATHVPSALSRAQSSPVPSDGGQGGSAPAGRRVVTKARILNAPRPVYTSEARENGTQGNVIVRAVLGVNGKVTSATVVRGLPDGLNETALEAAYKLEFTPAVDAFGHPIESAITVSISFTISGQNLNGTWCSIEPSGGETVQFFLQTGGGDEFRGYAILDGGPGDIACLPLTGRLSGGVLDLTATRASDGCTFRWTGRTGTAFFPIEEIRNCGASGEVIRRSFRLSSTP